LIKVYCRDVPYDTQLGMACTHVHNVGSALGGRATDVLRSLARLAGALIRTIASGLGGA